MASYESIYTGADYGNDPYHGEFMSQGSEAYPALSAASLIGLATDARTANQIKTTSEKFSTGAKVVEVQLTMPEIAESIAISQKS